MKILVTLDFPPEKGGIQRHLHGIVKYCYTSDDYVLVGCRNLPHIVPKDLSCRVKYLSVPFAQKVKKLTLVPLIVNLLKIKGTVTSSFVVECGNLYAGFAPWFISLFHPVSYTLYVHGTDLYSIGKGIKGIMLKNILHKACSVVANSRYTESLVVRLGYKGKITVRNPKLHVTKRDVENRFSSKTNSSGPVTIISVGRLVKEKGHAVLLKALSLLESQAEMRCAIIGKGPEKERLNTLCKSLNLARMVKFKDKLSDDALYREYAGADIFVLSSLPTEKGIEGFGIVLLEAMSFGVPVIASNCGGIPEVVGDTGFLVEPGDAHQLAGAIKKLMESNALRTSLAKKALSRVEKHYVWE
ncbi:MAG: glycosyltransferase [Chitinivibrionales bacterium]|nr:glycosyltransferase [Chitinivibrionales bacterium]